MATTTDLTLAEQHPQISPVIVDLGKKKRKAIKELKQAEGELMDEVAQVVEEVRKNLESELAGKVLLPVIILYEKKPKRRQGGLLPFGL